MLSDAGKSCIQRRRPHGTHKRIPLIDGKGKRKGKEKKGWSTRSCKINWTYSSVQTWGLQDVKQDRSKSVNETCPSLWIRTFSGFKSL